jgi:hypothetical protein
MRKYFRWNTNLPAYRFKVKKNEEAYTTIKKVEGLYDQGTIKVTFSINQTHTQQIELLAAIPYLKGVIEEELKKNPEAKLSLLTRLSVNSNFSPIAPLKLL